MVGLDWVTVFREKIEVEKEITEEKIKRLIKISGRQKILEKVFKFLSYRPRSQKEVREYLWRKKVDEEEGEAIVRQLEKDNYLNDEEFARWWVEQRTTFQPKGWQALKMELKQKGLKNEIIEEIRSQGLGVREFELAQKVAEKKLRSLGNLPSLELKQKLSATLARRGFDWETIKEVVDEICQKK